MTRHLSSLVALALALTSATSGAAAGDPTVPFWRKAWTVSGVLGPAAFVDQAKDSIGKPLELTAARAQTPYSYPCPNPPDYRDIRIRARTTLAGHFGAFWKFPAALGARPVAGWVRCPGGGNIGAFAFTDAHHGYYFFEDGLILTLK